MAFLGGLQYSFKGVFGFVAFSMERQVQNFYNQPVSTRACQRRTRRQQAGCSSGPPASAGLVDELNATRTQLRHDLIAALSEKHRKFRLQADELLKRFEAIGR